MIPIELTLKGIYSYQQQQTIDFTRLAEGRLFGIFGPVGCGKSTILEAITLALYNQAERLGGRGEKGENRNYNLMNLKSNELLVRFVFRAGKNFQEEYLAEVQGKRHRKNFASVGQYSRRLFKKAAGEWQPVETPMEEILGLSYENFRRTVIIPQGQFQEFLQLTPTLRTQMMKELFQLERFDLQQQTKRLQEKNDAAIQRFSGQLLEVEFASAELLAEKESALKKLRRGLKQEEKNLRRKEKEEKTLHALKEQFQKIEQLQAELKNMASQEEEFRRRESRLADYLQCRAEFKGLLERAEETARRIEEVEAELQEKSAARAGLQARLAGEEERFQTLKSAFRERETLKQKAAELSRVIQIRELEGEISGLFARLESEKQGGAEIQRRIETLKEEIEGWSRLLEKRRKELPDRQALAEMQHWFSMEAYLREGLETREREGEQLRREREKIEKRKQALLDSPELQESLPAGTKWLTPMERALPPPALLPILDRAQQQLEQEIREQEHAIEHLQLQAGMETLAEQLEEGQPCPVCGAREHPAKFKPRNLAAQLRKIQQKKETLQTQAKTITALRQSLGALQGEYNTREQAWEDFLKTREAERRKLEAHRGSFRWENFSPDGREALEEAQRQAEAAGQEIAALEEQRSRGEAQLEALRREKETAQQQLLEAERDYSAKQAARQLLIEQLQLLNYETYRETAPAELAAEAERLLAAYAQSESDYQQCEAQLAAARKELDTLAGRIETIEKNLQNYRRQQASLDGELREKIAQSTFPDVAAVQEILGLELDAAAEKSQIEEFFRKLHGAGAQLQQLQQLQQETAGRQHDEAAYRQLLKEIEELKTAASLAQRQIGGLEAEISKLKQALHSKTELQQRLAELQKRAENLGVLSSLFRGNGFVNYVSAVFLKNLCNAANQRFQLLTRRQLRLEVTEDNAFQVRDFLNGGQARSVKTLSGGQTFQAALCLALALADNVQQLSPAGQNFFFLDEGFGALDRESLRIVFDTLQSLRRERRIVGVISHVEEMQQEIDVYLKIRNDEEKGSLIAASWE
ncbi:MAG: SMC family ATPase [Calditrichaceae bacterium]|nr:SMC family ATPase [Calditrichia bacterium]NUQ40832.1 SMC family ATPase [Calditrichaceae bacterium]